MSNRVYSVFVKPIVLFMLVIVVAATGCGGGNHAGVTGATGGSTSGIGGMGGGDAATGGATVTGGGTVGATATGGMQIVTGGTATTGGIARTGGTPTAGGTGGGGVATGGANASGGTSSTGGMATGGVGGPSAGGTARGGAGATGGTTTIGGNRVTGGSASVGGMLATGGTKGGGGTGTGGTSAPSTGGPRWVGRIDAADPNAVRFAWQGAGVIATVNGTSIAVKLRTEGTPTVYFQPVIDGKLATRFNVDTGSDQTVTLATGLAAADHLVELYRDTEGMYGLSTFLGFTSGTVKGAPAPSGRLIEVVGDSISAGYGNLGSEPHPNWVASPACHWTAANSTWYQTYAAIAGHALNAEVSTIARSGWGMYRDNTGNTSGVLSSVYANALGTSSNAVWGFAPKASVVVINLGTNDWATGDPGTNYETAYESFITTVRSHYPDAWIFLTIGSMTSDPALSQVKTRLANVVAALAATGDQKLVTFDLGVQNMGSDGSVPTGCDWHPNVADHQRMAGILQQQLSSKLGW